MGILNVTPDSFYDQGRFKQLDRAIAHGISLYQEGADILDIGGESTRPGSLPVSEEEELARVIPVITALHQSVPIPLSIDTQKARVAAAAIEAGATLINDVSGCRDPEMRAVAAASQVDICIMHMQGTPKNMQEQATYPEGIIAHLLHWFDQQITLLLDQGVARNRLIIDPGIGFGKTVADNLEIIQNLPKLQKLGFPLLMGISRKSFMGKILHKGPAELLPATIAINTFLAMNKVDIIRVHDVGAHRDAINLLNHLV